VVKGPRKFGVLLLSGLLVKVPRPSDTGRIGITVTLAAHETLQGRGLFRPPVIWRSRH